MKIVFIIVFLFADLSNTFNEHNGVRTAIFVLFQKWSNKKIILKLLESESYFISFSNELLQGSVNVILKPKVQFWAAITDIT